MADEDEVVSANNNDLEVFVYTEGAKVPIDVVRARVHPSATVILDRVFQNRNRLEEIELYEGLLEIGRCAFYNCKALKYVNIPSTVKTIGSHAFDWAPLQTLYLPDSIESIRGNAFCGGRFPTVRIPPRITTIAEQMFSNCSSMFSAELPETITWIAGGLGIEAVFYKCRSLRNIAVPSHAIGGVNTFKRCTDLLQRFVGGTQIIYALKHRFDRLPIHKMIYYHSYNNLTSEQLRNAINISSSQPRSYGTLILAGSQQDCLGMTPLHILACSTVQNMELYQVLIEKYPENLIVNDEWGTVPLFYAAWGNAPNEIVQLLVEKYLSIYPDYEFDWTGMITTLGGRNAPESIIQSLIDLQKASFPSQNIDWDRVLNTVANVVETESSAAKASLERIFRFMVNVSTATRVDAIGIKQWRDDMSMVMIESISWRFTKRQFLDKVKSKLSHYEAEYQQLKEAATILELALWKTKLGESNGQNQGGTQHSKKRKIEDFDFRKQCRVNCGADIVIEYVLAYLVEKAPANNTGLSSEIASKVNY